MKSYLIAAAVLAALPTSTAHAAQRVSVTLTKTRFEAPGLDHLRPGWITLAARNTATSPEGMDVVALRSTSFARARKILNADTMPAKLPITLVSGPPQLDPGETWEGTFRVRPGRYVLMSDAGGSHHYHRIFTVRGAPSPSAPPRPVGSIALQDFRFGFNLPAAWNGRGVVKITNPGRQIHEISFVHGRPAMLAKLHRQLEKGYPQGPPPKSVKITYSLGGVSHGQTTFERMHLAPGRYLAVCLMPDPHTGKPHTAMGMMRYLTVR